MIDIPRRLLLFNHLYAEKALVVLRWERSEAEGPMSSAGTITTVAFLS